MSTSVPQSRYESLSNIQARPSTQQEQQRQTVSKSKIPVKNSSIPRRANSSSKRKTTNISDQPGSSTVPATSKTRREGSVQSLTDERETVAAPSEPKATLGTGKERSMSPPPKADHSKVDDKDAPKSPEVSLRNNSVSFAKSTSSKHSRKSSQNITIDKDEDETDENRSKRTEGDASLTHHASSFRAVYAYPDNKNVVTWTATDPKTALTTTMTLLDTRPTDSRSILSQTRRVSDQKLRQHQMDIQRELFSSQRSFSRARDKDDSLNKSIHKGEQSLRKDSEKSFSKSSRHEYSLTSSHKGRSESPSSPSSPLSHRRSIGDISPNKSREVGSRKQLQRVMSSQIFIPNPRGIAPTPSPDQSTELVRRLSLESDKSLVRSKQNAHQERMRLYEEQLDRRIVAVQENNRRLLELKFLLEKQRERERVLAIEEAQAEDDLSDEERERKKVELERERERLEWEEAKILLEQSHFLQQQQKDDLERERGTRQELESSVNQMSSQLQELLELSETQAKEIEESRIKAAQDHDQWEELRLGLEQRNQHLESRWDTHVADAEKRIQSEKTQTQDLAAAVDSLEGYNQELKDRLQQQESKSQASLSRQTEQTERYKSKVRDLERQLAMEKESQSEDQEARDRVMARFDELGLKVKQKEDEVQGLQSLLEDRDELLERRQGQLDEALEIVRSLEDQLQDMQANMHDNQQQKEQQRKTLKQHQSELREIGKVLALEQESSRKHQRHIEILLETQQESSQLHETKIQQLQDELDKCSQQLSMSAVSSSTSSSALHQLQVQIQDQEHILLEKEDRIQELEQDLRQAQQQAQSVVADLEQDVQELDQERLKISNQLQKTHLQVEAEKIKVKELEDQLHREQGMAQELDRQQEQELVMLEHLLADIESEGGPTTDLGLLEGPAGDLYGQLRNKIGDLVHERGELLEQRAYQEQTLADQRQQLERCESEIEAQQDQLLRLEQDRKAVEEQVHHFQDDLDLARHQQHQLREQVRSRDMLLKEHANSMSKSQFGSSQYHRQQQQDSPQNGFKSDLHQQISTLEQQVMLLEEEKQQALGQLDLSQARIKKMGEMIQDQMQAAKSIREKYLSKIAELKLAVTEYRDTIVKQEGQMFLYLSVIEKLKLQMKGGRVMMRPEQVDEDVNETISNETDGASDTNASETNESDS
ncbi:MAG: hypothetical protein BYD32DRAFT_440567 [Podila humilis]|nr:MAG: hypothetical protein BYD32DRAFT_440567 [Podila humilis]